MCSSDKNVYLTNKAGTKYHIRDTNLTNKMMPICRRKGNYKIFKGHVKVFPNRICASCITKAN